MMDNIHVGTGDYPLGKRRPGLVKSFSGKGLDEITIDAVLKGEINNKDIRISPESLLMQADIAEDAGRFLLAQNFRRAAELCDLSDERIMEYYRALRPFRSTADDLETIAAELETEHNALLCADMFREVAAVYRKRGLLKK